MIIGCLDTLECHKKKGEDFKSDFKGIRVIVLKSSNNFTLPFKILIFLFLT